MHATQAANATAQPQPVSRPRLRPVWLVSAAAGAIALAVTELFWAVIRLSGVPIVAAGFGQAKAQPVTAGLIALGIFTCTFWGTVLAVVIARYATRPARLYLLATVVLTAASLAMPLSAADTATSTKLALSGAHVLAAAVIIPLVTRRLARRIQANG